MGIGETLRQALAKLVMRAAGEQAKTACGNLCWNLIPDSLDQVESQIDSNTIYYFEFQTWNLTLQPA